MAELDAEEAVAHVARGGLVAFPTETSWGLAADARSATAVDALCRFKGRAGKPLSVVIADGHTSGLIRDPSETFQRLSEALWPGPLTLVVSGGGELAPGVAGAGGTLGLRCSPHPDVRRLAQTAAQQGVGPLTATSLNRSGEPAVETRDAARELCAAGTGAVLLRGGECGGGPVSTVLDCTTSPPTVLREGAVSRATLESLLGPLRVAPTEPAPTS